MSSPHKRNNPPDEAAAKPPPKISDGTRPQMLFKYVDSSGADITKHVAEVSVDIIFFSIKEKKTGSFSDEV